MLSIGLTVIGIAMLIWPSAMEGAVASGRHGLIKEVLIAVWGVKGGLWFIGLGAVYLAWLFRPWRPSEATTTATESG